MHPSFRIKLFIRFAKKPFQNIDLNHSKYVHTFGMIKRKLWISKIKLQKTSQLTYNWIAAVLAVDTSNLLNMHSNDNNIDI
jgi:hypothetical protein